MPNPEKPFPRFVAVFNDRFIFTTLTSRDIASHARTPFTHPTNLRPCSIFSLDDMMDYIPFAADYGPLNLSFTYKACLEIHERLSTREHQRTPLCLYTSTDPKRKANMALMTSLYALIVEHKDPWEAFQPIAPMEVLSFRDAGNGVMDYALSIQDCLYGVSKAVRNDLLDLVTFDGRHYEYYEQVNNGDLNVLGPFIPFASPSEAGWIKTTRSTTTTTASPEASSITTHTTVKKKAKMATHTLNCLLKVFQEENVGLVVRLNDELYDRRHFLNIGVDHVEMYFDDGTNPPDSIVRDFIRLAEETIARRKKVAVHCKAGLGRTGVLIGAYLIYKYQFSAQEVIGYMRIVRPGMVVGPQQQYMVMNQMKWAAWAAQDRLIKELASDNGKGAGPNTPFATPPSEASSSLPASLPPRGIDPQGRSVLEHLTVRLHGSASAPSDLLYSKPRALSPPCKGGDAVGQPRKTPARHNTALEPNMVHVRVHIQPASPTPDATVLEASQCLASRHRNPNEGVSTTMAASTRGIKRASSRTPLLANPSLENAPRIASPVSPTLDVPSALQRCLSTTSLASSSASENDRPYKRRIDHLSAGLSPLSKTGLSSPPPSRDSSPAEDVDMAAPAEERFTRLPNKLRRRTPSNSPDIQIQDPSTPAHTAHLSSPPNSTDRPTVKVTSGIPVSISRRRFIAVGPSPIKEVSPVLRVTAKEVESRRAMAKSEGPAVREKEAQGVIRRTSNRRLGMGLSPPRFARDLMARMGSAPPGA